MAGIRLVALAVVLLCGMAPATREASVTADEGAATRPAKEFRITYSLIDGHEQWPEDKKAAVVKAMDEAVAMYNEVGAAVGGFDKHITVRYHPGVPTAEANWDGRISFGGQIGTRTAMHEIGHTLGVGTVPVWREMFIQGRWIGPAATALVREFDGPEAVVRGDRHHFWPYGLNFDREGGERNMRRHVLMVAALRADMGIVNGEKPDWNVLRQRIRASRPTTAAETRPTTAPAAAPAGR